METLVATRRRVFRVPHVRATNRAAVLQLLRRHQRLSRAEIARRTGLSEAAVSRIVAQLLHDELLIAQAGEDSTGGRPGICLQLNEARFQAIGVDIQNWETRISLGTIAGRVLETQRFRTPATPQKTLELIARKVEAYVSRPGVHAVGLSAPGLVNSDTGVAELGRTPSWVHVTIKEYLAERLHRPVFVENDVRAAALAEYHYGAQDIQNSHCLLFLMVGEGVGMGIILDGKLYCGPRMAAGEIGQMVIRESPGPERHNRAGCLEMLASDLATCEKYKRLVGGKNRVNSGNSAAQVKQICHLAMQGDRAARQALLEACRYLGVGIANTIWALDVDTVVIDGALTEAWPLVLPAIQEQFPAGREFLSFHNLTLRPSSLRGEAAIIGAITLPFAGLFSTEEGARL